MDDLNNSFGRLSTQAPEWKPGGGGGGGGGGSSSSYNASSRQQQQPQHPSDLQASTVKEFVPGRGWSSSSGQEQQGTQSSTASVGEEDGTADRHRHHHLHDADDAAVSSDGVGGMLYDDGPSTTASGPSPAPLPSFRALHSAGVGYELWKHYRQLSLEMQRQMDPADPLHKAVPLPYCNAYCLDRNRNSNKNKKGSGPGSGSGSSNRQSSSRSSFGYPSGTYQVTNRDDGQLYCLHRFDSVRSVSPKIAAAVTDRWTSTREVREHPGVVPLYLCFLAQRAVFFVHPYVPGARTLAERLAGQPLAEPVLWSCIVQIVSALRVIHTAGLAVRCLDASHVLSLPDASNSKLRVRLNCLGVVDALEFEARKHVGELQVQDIRGLGRLILSLATGSNIGTSGPSNSNIDGETLRQCDGKRKWQLPRQCYSMFLSFKSFLTLFDPLSTAFVAQNFSRELHNLAMTLVQSPRPPSITDICRAISLRCFDEQDSAYQQVDFTSAALASEYESSRAFRLLLKLGFVNERPEFGPNRRWSQSGDCYGKLSRSKIRVEREKKYRVHRVFEMAYIFLASVFLRAVWIKSSYAVSRFR